MIDNVKSRPGHQKPMVLCCLLMLGLTAGAGAEPARPYGSGMPSAECRKIAHSEVRNLLIQISRAAFEQRGELVRHKVMGAITRGWIDNGGDEVVNRVVDAARAQITAEESPLSRFASGWEADRANEFGYRISNYAFQSKDFRALLMAVTQEAPDALGAVIETAAAEAATGASECLKEFADARWPRSLASLYRQTVETIDIDAQEIAGGGPISTSQLASIHISAMGGAAVVVSSQVVYRILALFAAKMPARVAMATIPYVGLVIGGGLIIFDVVSNKEGVIPADYSSAQIPFAQSRNSCQTHGRDSHAV